MNNLPYDCSPCAQAAGFCFNAGQMGGLPTPNGGSGEVPLENYTGGQIIWTVGGVHPQPACTPIP